jgi:energy-coupling factor transport system substrate-specific component
MSWEAAVFLLLGVTLIAAVVWYERAQPPAQVVALVAALAALAVVGRVALSPVPNVVPTTDIALISGYTLGGAPGFAVGALAALVSNFWLGQGPWTPWQMAGWGLAGTLGALLAVLTGRRMGRLGLAVACGIAGLAYGALLDFSLMVTYGGEQSLERFLALSARGLPFNLAHAAGNVALALVAGPALVRMLLRYRGRFEFAWRAPARRRATRGALAGAGCALAAVAVAGGLAGGQPAAAAGSADAVKWLRSAQNEDGGFAAEPGGDSSPEMTGWATLGLEAAGVDPRAVSRGGGATPIAYLKRTVGEITSTGDLERTILVLSAANLDPRRFKGQDLVARLLRGREGDGSWGGEVNATAFGVLALRAAGESAGGRSARWLRRAANDDGGWGFVPGTTSDPDSTGAALQALAATGGSRGAIRDGVAWLRSAQREGGGFALLGGPVNAQSTAWAVQGLVAAGVSPRGVRRGGDSPTDYLASVQAADGHYRYSRSLDQTPVWVTGQALQAASGQALPLRRVAAAKLQPSRKGAAGATAGAPVAGAQGSTVGGAGAAPGPGGTSRGNGKGQPPLPKPAPVSPEAEIPVELDPASGVQPAGADDSPLPEIAAGTVALLALIGGPWLLRRQRAG